MRSLKGYEVFGVALIIKEKNKYLGFSHRSTTESYIISSLEGSLGGGTTIVKCPVQY